MLASHSVRELQESGLLRTPAVTAEERREQDLMAPVTEWVRTGSLAMRRSYRTLFVLENLVRDFVSTRFTEVDGDKWFDTRASASMKQKVKQRVEEEKRNQWHIGQNRGPISYLDFGDLSLLITNNWGVFKDFIDNQTWVQGRMQDAERTRNVIAHTNLLSVEEGDRLEMHLRDWIKQIG